MAASGTRSLVHRSSLEDFVCDYLETAGGAWDEVERQVYDVLPAPVESSHRWDARAQAIERITFDPEALPEHPGAQLASFGTPLVDRWLEDAVRRGRTARLYLLGLNLAWHDLAARVRRAVSLPPECSLRLRQVRPLDFPQAVFWFQATFTSDQKEQEIVPAAVDLHYNRLVRHTELLLEPSRLAGQPSVFLAEAPSSSLAKAYLAARDRVVRTITALTNSRSRELGDRVERQVARMTRYYGDLSRELDEHIRRSRQRAAEPSKFAGRREAIDREERLRVAEIRQKTSLSVHLQLVNLVVVHQPKLLVPCVVISGQRELGRLELVWDPLAQSVEAAPCPACQLPTLAFGLSRLGQVVCPACAAAAGPKATRPKG